MSDFRERRDLSMNRRATGWRWNAARSDRRKIHVVVRPEQVRRIVAGRFGGRRVYHRRRSDRDDD